MGTSCKTQEGVTTGYCPAPKREQFRDEDVFREAERMRDAHNAQYRKEYYAQATVKERENELARERYHAKKATEDGRAQLRDKMQRDEQNKRARMESQVPEGMLRCPVGPHDACEADFFFDPVDDLDMSDYKGDRSRSRRRHVCKKHFASTVARNRRHNAKPERKAYNAQREQLLWVKDRRKKWKQDHREHCNRVRRLFFRNNPDKARARAEKSREYSLQPEVAKTLAIMKVRAAWRKKGVQFAITEAAQDRLFSLEATCFYCGTTSATTTPLGINRLDMLATVVTDDNVVTSCKPCKMARCCMPPERFYKACNNVALYATSGIANRDNIPYAIVEKRTIVHLSQGVSFDALSRTAKKKNLEVRFDTNAHNRMRYHSACYLCGLCAIPNVHALGVDRVDSRQGYTLENSRPCCTCCNMMKKASTMDDFVERCCKVAELHATFVR